MVDALLKARASTGVRDDSMRTALGWAKDQGFVEIEKRLKQNGAVQ